jgi:hypothetical protein
MAGLPRLRGRSRFGATKAGTSTSFWVRYDVDGRDKPGHESKLGRLPRHLRLAIH